MAQYIWFRYSPGAWDTCANDNSKIQAFIFKRQSMTLHGQSEFDVFAKPVVSAEGASVFYMYDGYAKFVEETRRSRIRT